MRQCRRKEKLKTFFLQFAHLHHHLGRPPRGLPKVRLPNRLCEQSTDRGRLGIISGVATKVERVSSVGPAAQPAEALGPASNLQAEVSPSPALMVPEDNCEYLDLVRAHFRAPPVQLVGDSFLDRSVSGMNDGQALVHSHLRVLYKRGFTVRWPHDANATAGPFVFNEPTWGRVLSSLSLSVKNSPSCLADCWVSDKKLDSSGYPQIKVTPGDYEERFSHQGTRFYSDRKETERPLVKCAKLASVLGHPKEMVSFKSGDRSRQTDHLCGNNGCFNPWHINVATDQENKSRHRCRFGCAILCPHVPKCIFVNKVTGKAIPCLNLVGVDALSRCECDPDCLSQAGLRLT